jgi:alpha-1,6-mannosyltransferase
MRTETLPTESRLDAAREIEESRLTFSAPALLAAGSLAGLTLGSFVIVLMAAERPSTFTPTSAGGYFPAWMAGPLRALLPGLTHNEDRLAWLLSGVMLAMYVLYIVAFRFADRVRAGWTISALLAIHLAFLLSPPLQYTDVFNYIHYARMGALDGLNPYTVIPALAPHADASFALSNWRHLLSPYGPAFTLFSYVLVPLGVAGSFWAIKLAVGLASLGTLALVWRCAQLLGRSPASAAAFVGLNPIVLVWGLGADHNDSLMLFFVVLAVYLTLRTPAAPRAAGAALVLAVFIKASAAALAPVFIAAGHRRGLIRGGLAAVAVLGTASVIAFGAHAPDLSTQSRLVTAIGLPNLLGLVLGQGGETHALHLAVSLAVVAVVAGCTAAVARGRMNWLTAAAVVLAAVTVSLSWAVPWYLVWVLPFAALAPARRMRGAVVLLGAYFLIAFMPAAYLLARDLHFAPQSTHLGVVHRRQVEALLH